MNAADVIGWYLNGSPFCADCFTGDEDAASPVFGDSESDSFSHCEECGDLIPESLTSDGVRYCLDAFDDWRADVYRGRIREAGCLEAWADALDWYGLGRLEKLRIDKFRRTLARERAALAEVRA